VKEWIEIRKVGSEDDGARYFPVFPNGSASLPEPGPDGIIKGGWSREHCDICREHIESGEIGLLDRSGHKLCEKCHRQYVLTHHLSFLGVF
jgi:predicted CXXCH cytochrome family protein